jgi:hypothetical protein
VNGNSLLGPGGRLLLFLLIISFSQAAFADKTDIVYLKNGDRTTGEVKSLQRGKLEFSTDGMGTLYIEWENIANIISKTGQAIELTNGERFYGTLTRPETDSMLTLDTGLGQVGVPTDDVILMYPVEADFWDRLDLSIKFGLSWDKGSNVGRYNLGMDAEYRLPGSLTRAAFNTEVTTQDSASSTQRSNLSGIHNIFLENKKYHTYFASLERNDQLGLDLRSLIGAGYGYMPIRSQRNELMLAGGLNVNREIPTEGEQQTNIEAVFVLNYNYFKFSTPERSFNTELMVFPSITDWGRWRANFNTDFRWEMVSDLYWILDFYASFDSAPISPDAATSDYGVTSSLGYKF